MYLSIYSMNEILAFQVETRGLPLPCSCCHSCYLHVVSFYLGFKSTSSAYFSYIGLVRCGTKGPLFVSATDRKAFWLARAKAGGHYTSKTVKEKKNKQVGLYRACIVSRFWYID